MAHSGGRLELSQEEKDWADVVTGVTQLSEASVGSDWEFEPDTREAHRKQLKGIVAFRLEAKEITIKMKLSQNHPEANIKSVIENLPKTDQRDAPIIAEQEREKLNTSRPGD